MGWWGIEGLSEYTLVSELDYIPWISLWLQTYGLEFEYYGEIVWVSVKWT